ncbi:MAG: hypothetical protein OXD32_00670 [Endozoicomonadaceae bacterium]|nr:hypothetical protein [Endozoicomonadaceae bacterium]
MKKNRHWFTVICLILIIQNVWLFSSAKKKVHKNTVSFVGKSFQSISFYMDKYCITRNQPFHGISVDRKKIVVRAGRHRSLDIANCFWRWTNTSSYPDMHLLNFSIGGTLVLSSGTKTLALFEDCALGQGHSGAKNNWWFGGIHCRYHDRHANVPYGRTDREADCLSEKKEHWCFTRKYSHINKIFVEKGRCVGIKDEIWN